jgi:hypothetical protein
MTQQDITLDQFIDEHQLEMSVRAVKRNPNMQEHMPRNFECCITQVGRGNSTEMVVYFSQGGAHRKPPTLAEVLDCLASGIAGVDNANDFEDWANEFGYNTDSRKAEHTYDVCRQQAQELKDLLGGKAYAQLIYKTERL